MSTKAIGLVRVSTVSQAGDDRAGIAAQRYAIDKMARSQGIDVVDVVQLVDVPGSEILHAPEFQELLRRIESPEIGYLLVKEVSRLLRPESFSDFALLEHLVATNTLLCLPDGIINLNDKYGKFFATIRTAVAGLERHEIAKRMQDAKEQMRREGRHPGGATTLPRGIAYSTDEGWHYKDEIDQVRQVFDLFRSGIHNYHQISRIVGLPRTSASFILRNPAYAGRLIYKQKRDMSAAGYVPRSDGRRGYRKKIDRSPDEIIEIALPLDPIVTWEEFEKIQSIINDKRSRCRVGRAVRSEKFIFTGFLKCHNCGSSIYTHSNSRQFFYYCRAARSPVWKEKLRERGIACDCKFMGRDRLEAKIENLLETKLGDRNFLSGVVNHYLAQQFHQDNFDSLRSSLRSRTEQLAKKRQRILESFFDGSISKTERDCFLEKIEFEIKEVMQTEIPEPVEIRLNDEQVGGLVSVFTEYRFLDREQKRDLLSDLVPEIYVYNDEVYGLDLCVNCGASDCDSDNRPPGVVARPPARASGIRSTRPGKERRYGPGILHRVEGWRCLRPGPRC